MTATELAALIGRRGTLTSLAEKLTVPIVIRDARQAFQRLDVLVAVESTDSAAWVNLERVRLEEK